MGVQHSAERDGARETEGAKYAVPRRSIDRRCNLLAGLSLRSGRRHRHVGICGRDLHELSQRSQPSHCLSTQQHHLRFADKAHFTPPSAAYRASNGADSCHAADRQPGHSMRPARVSMSVVTFGSPESEFILGSIMRCDSRRVGVRRRHADSLKAVTPLPTSSLHNRARSRRCNRVALPRHAGAVSPQNSCGGRGPHCSTPLSACRTAT
jgi:hypothetical protein